MQMCHMVIMISYNRNCFTPVLKDIKIIISCNDYSMEVVDEDVKGKDEKICLIWLK